jgi:hypothetical protein
MTKEQREVILQFAEDLENCAVIEELRQSALDRPPTGGKVERKSDGFQRIAVTVNAAFEGLNWTAKIC